MMESNIESCIPPGFRFHPTDEELVGYYLNKKISSQKIDLDVIRDIDLYKIEPWDLKDLCRIGYEEQREWYFFSHKDKKYPTGTRTNRATMAGFWKATGRDKAVYDKVRLIGMRKTLVFYKGRAPNGQKSDWIMHEYRLETDENGPPQEEGWVVCRAFKKRTTSQNKGNERWDSRYFYEEPSNGINSFFNPINSYRQPKIISSHNNYNNNNNFMCKQEMENMNFMSLQLPQLESPCLPLEEDQQICEKVADWRELDKFVASQLSHEERYSNCDDGGSSFEAHRSSDMALMLLQSDHEENKLSNGYLNSSSDFDIGICFFDK